MQQKKEYLIVNAAGNEGNNAWHFIITPADGDSVLAVGAVNANGIVAPFSSYGPSSDGQVKPDVASVGVATVVQQPSNVIGTSNGTSFACPNIAGLTTCLWQGFPEFNNMKIINALRSSGSIAAMPNDRIGYGIPDVKKALLQLTKDFSTASATTANCKTTLNWTSKDVATMKYEIERKSPGDSAFTKIGERQGSGVVFGNRNYEFSDPVTNLPAGTIQYRIRQVIDTTMAGFTAGYIDTVSTMNTSCTSNELLVISPNPTRNTFNLQVNTIEAQSLDVRISNGLGQIMMQLKRDKPAGSFVIPFTGANLPAGKYFISVYGANKLIGTKELLKL